MIALKQYRKNRTLNNLTTYKQSKSNFKSVCDLKKKSYFDKKLIEITESVDNPKSFWKRIKLFTKSKPVENDITREDWKKHFEKLFQIPDNDKADDEISTISENVYIDEREDYIFSA